MTNSKWERDDFPLVCHTCLGDNPYVRMIRLPYDAACHICVRPFTVYKWKAGTEGRVKKTEICPTCAKVKHVCQTCMFDIDSGLPVEFRDSFLETAQKDPKRPESALVRQYQSNVNESAVLTNQLKDYTLANQLALGSLGRTVQECSNYKRNRSKICTFFLKGTCNRGEYCPFRHETTDHLNPDLSKQNIKDRYYGTEDPVARLMKEKVKSSEADVHPSQTSVFVSGFDTAKISEKDLKDRFYCFGQIITIKIVPNVGAFVEYTRHEEAKKAIELLKNNLVIKGQFMKVNWAKSSNQSKESDSSNNSGIPPILPLGFAPFAPNASGYCYYPSMNPNWIGANPNPVHQQNQNFIPYNNPQQKNNNKMVQEVKKQTKSSNKTSEINNNDNNLNNNDNDNNDNNESTKRVKRHSSEDPQLSSEKMANIKVQ